MSLKLSSNKKTINNEIQDGKFDLSLEDHIFHLKSFIDKEKCLEVVDSLIRLEKDTSTPYTDGLLNKIGLFKIRKYEEPEDTFSFNIGGLF